jgi:hypothetical protein
VIASEDVVMLTPLLRFHVRAGARLALRAAAPAVGLPIVGLILQDDPAGAAAALAAWLVAPAGAAANSLALALVAIPLSAWAMPRLAPGLSGWLRHLPATGADCRRATLGALVVSQSPLLVAWLVAAVAAAGLGRPVSPGRLAALLVTIGGAALAAWPGRYRWRSAPLGLAAIVVASSAHVGSLLVGAAVLLLAAEPLAGPLAPPRPSRARRLRVSPHVPLLVALRALGRTSVTAPLVALLPIAAMTAFRLNNTELAPGVAAGAARLGGGLGAVVVAAGLVGRLFVRRPAWPWSRSLPWSAAVRVDADAVLVAAFCLVPVCATAAMDAAAALAVAASVPALAFRAAGALRWDADTKAGPSGRILAEGALVACWVALVPWLAVAVLAAAPLARKAAVGDDRRQKVSRWQELHHAAAGDPLSWSSR